MKNINDNLSVIEELLAERRRMRKKALIALWIAIVSFGVSLVSALLSAFKGVN